MSYGSLGDGRYGSFGIPGKQVDIYSMKTGKLVRTVRKGKK